jgi:hypothetical protein
MYSVRHIFSGNTNHYLLVVQPSFIMAKYITVASVKCEVESSGRHVGCEQLYGQPVSGHGLQTRATITRQLVVCRRRAASKRLLDGPTEKEAASHLASPANRPPPSRLPACPPARPPTYVTTGCFKNISIYLLNLFPALNCLLLTNLKNDFPVHGS